MLICYRCGHAIDTENLTEVVAFQTIGAVNGQATGLAWAHILCECEGSETRAAYLNAEERDGDTYLTISQMEEAVQNDAEDAYERVYTRGR